MQFLDEMRFASWTWFQEIHTSMQDTLIFKKQNEMQGIYFLL